MIYMARRTKLNPKTRYIVGAGEVVTKNMYTGEILNIQPAIEPKDLYKLLYSKKNRRRKELVLAGGWVRK